jgi:excisionase family DNA binding protein
MSTDCKEVNSVSLNEARTASEDAAALSNRLTLSLDEVAKQLGVSVGFLRLEIGRQKLRPIRLGRRVLIHREEVSRYLTHGSR